MHKLNRPFLVCVLALLLSISTAFGSAKSGFSKLPNSLEQVPLPAVKSIVFGVDVLGILIPKSVSVRCECLLVWNGAHWSEDSYYVTFGANVLGVEGFYRPYNYSQRAYSVEVSKENWSKVKKSNQFSQSFKSKQFNTFSVVQLDSPHAPFVYVEMNLNGKLKVFRLETPQDLTPNIEAWLKNASFKSRGNDVNLSLTYDLYQTGTGQEPGPYTIHYEFKDGSWYALQSR